MAEVYDERLLGLIFTFARMVEAFLDLRPSSARYYQARLQEMGISVEMSGSLANLGKRPWDTRLLSASDLAEILGVHRKTLIRWYKAGRLPGSRPGRTYYFVLDRVVDALEKDAEMMSEVKGARRGREKLKE